LDDRHGPATAIRDALPARLPSQEAKPGAHEDTHDRAAQGVIPREQIPKAMP
jgi:hypothetical protein